MATVTMESGRMECVQDWAASSGRQKIRSVASLKTIASRVVEYLHTAMEVITRDSFKTTRDMVLAKVSGLMVLITLVFGRMGRKTDLESQFQHVQRFVMGFGDKVNGFVITKRANSLW